MTYAGHVCLRFLISKTETRTATTNVAGHLVFVERLEQAQYRDDNDDNINKMRINKCEKLQGYGALLMRAIRGLPPSSPAGCESGPHTFALCARDSSPTIHESPLGRDRVSITHSLKSSLSTL